MSKDVGAVMKRASRFLSKHLTWVALALGLILIGWGLCYTVPRYELLRKSEAVPKLAVSPFSPHTKPAPVVQPVVAISGRPVHIQIPSVGINIPVIDGYYYPATNGWTLTNYAAQYAVQTPLANNTEGNTFIYGHNRHSVFEALLNIKLGAEAIITTDNGHTFTYVFKGALITTPSNLSLFSYQGPPILTLQTCSGTFYQNRQLFTFDLESAN